MITQVDQKADLTDCVFCKIISGVIPSKKIQETENIIVIRDILPKAAIHYLIIPKKHYRDLTSVSESDSAILSNMFITAQQLSKDIGDFKLILNNGFSAGQRVFHLHMHFLAGEELSGI